jgi:hypothetical protein
MSNDEWQNITIVHFDNYFKHTMIIYGTLNYIKHYKMYLILIIKKH